MLGMFTFMRRSPFMILKMYSMPMFDVASYPERLRQSYADRTLVGRLGAIFGAVGLLLDSQSVAVAR